jgi:hypothetical protein
VIQASTAVGDIDITPVQQSIIAPTIEQLRCGALLREAHSSIAAAQKIPERRPDQLGAIGGECCVANGPDRMEKLEQELQLSVSLGVRNARAQADDKRKKAVISEARPPKNHGPASRRPRPSATGICTNKNRGFVRKGICLPWRKELFVCAHT